MDIQGFIIGMVIGLVASIKMIRDLERERLYGKHKRKNDALFIGDDGELVSAATASEQIAAD